MMVFRWCWLGESKQRKKGKFGDKEILIKKPGTIPDEQSGIGKLFNASEI